MKKQAAVLAVLMVFCVGCATLSQMTPTERAKTAVGLAVLVANQTLTAMLIIDPDADVAEIQARITQISALLVSTIEAVNLLIPEGNDAVSAYAAEELAKLDMKAAEFTDGLSGGE